MVQNNFYLCLDCKNKLTKGALPALSHKNNLELIDLSNKEELHLTELENCLEEVGEEVKEMIGHWEFDEAGNWRKIEKEDDNVKSAMFESVEHHIEEEMESMYVTVLQNLKDSAAKIGKEIKKIRSDDDLSKPMRLKRSFYLGSHFWVPRNVILK